MLWSLFWSWLSADNPAVDPTISTYERKYIEENTDNRDAVKVTEPSLLVNDILIDR